MKLRAALAVSAILALGGALAPSYAEDVRPVASAQVAVDQDLPRFTPSEDGFGQAFEKFEDASGEVAVPPHAVDMDTIEPVEEPAVEELGSGVASYYGRRFAGRPTASGERFDPQDYTAAHRTLPFGSKVRVTNTRTGKSVIVRVNDRGPFVKGRTIDLSRRAAEDIGIVGAGHGTVQLALLAS